MAAHIDDFLTELANANRLRNTVRAYRGDLNAFAAHHGGDIAGLTPHRAARRPRQLALLRLYLTRFGFTVGPLFRASINGRGPAAGHVGYGTSGKSDGYLCDLWEKHPAIERGM